MPCSRVTLQNLANFETRHFRQHQIENDEGRLFAPRFVEAGRTIAGRGNDEPARFAQIEHEQIDNVLLVFDDEDGFARHRDHAEAGRAGLLLRFARDAFFRAGFFVQCLGKILQTGDDLGRFAQHGGREFFGVIGPALRHFRKRHHHGERVVNRVFDFAESALQLREFFLGDVEAGFTHNGAMDKSGA